MKSIQAEREQLAKDLEEREYNKSYKLTKEIEYNTQPDTFRELANQTKIAGEFKERTARIGNKLLAREKFLRSRLNHVNSDKIKKGIFGDDLVIKYTIKLIQFRIIKLNRPHLRSFTDDLVSLAEDIYCKYLTTYNLQFENTPQERLDHPDWSHTMNFLSNLGRGGMAAPIAGSVANFVRSKFNKEKKNQEISIDISDVDPRLTSDSLLTQYDPAVVFEKKELTNLIEQRKRRFELIHKKHIVICLLGLDNKDIMSDILPKSATINEKRNFLIYLNKLRKKLAAFLVSFDDRLTEEKSEELFTLGIKKLKEFIVSSEVVEETEVENEPSPISIALMILAVAKVEKTITNLKKGYLEYG